MRRLLTLLLIILFYNIKGQEKPFINPGGETAVWSLYAYNATKGKVIAQTPQRSLTPASVMKLVTSATAIELLGPDYQFVTSLKYSGKINHDKGVLEGDLYIIGGGDPAFYSEYFTEHYENTFENWAAALKRRGIREVDGDIIADISIIQDEPVPGGWIWEDIGNYYGAGVYGLTFGDNLYKIHFSTGKKTGEKARIKSIEPDIEGLEIDNRVTSSEVKRDLAYIFSPPGSFNQVIRGTIPRNLSDFVVKGAMPSPPIVASRNFKKALEANGINFKGEIILQKEILEIPLKSVAQRESPLLRDIVKALNINSNNLYAEHLIREIGRYSNCNSSLESGLKAVINFWKERDIYLDGFFMTDGSGLSRSNAICARTLVEIMLFMRESENRDYYFSSLPLAGRDGTLKYFFNGTPLEERLAAKTGSMERVRSLSGFFINDAGEEIVFAVVVNNFEGSSYDMGKKLEPVILQLFNGIK